MALGPGRYDAELEKAIASAQRKSPLVRGGVLIIRGAAGHNGFSAQLSLEDLHALPDVLRSIADQMDADIAAGVFPGGPN
jgi:hypothetical protein